jgi:Lon-like protease
VARGTRYLPLVVGSIVGLLLIAAVVLYLVPSNDFLLLPDGAHPVAPLVQVQGGHDPTGPGGIYFVDIFERRASELESLFPFIRSGATLVPASLLVPPGVSDAAQRRADLQEMTTSQQVAAAVALRRLGYHVVAKPNGVTVDAIDLGTHAVGKLEPEDVIVSVNGTQTPTVAKLRSVLALVHPGQTVALGIRRGAQTLNEKIQTIADPTDPHHAIVGFSPDQSALIRLPLRVRIDVGNVGGPSAGLAFALEVMEKLGHNVDHGYKVAATGQIELNGAVSPIGGIKQKTFGVREAKADVFLVPVGDGNASDARRYAHGLKIIPVTSFAQALKALAALPAKH